MKISILGSCLLRDIFNSKFVPEYAEHFKVDSYFARTTIPSVMSKPGDYDLKDFEKRFDPLRFEYFYTECSKCMLSIFGNNDSDYLLIDFYADVYYGTCEYEGAYYSNWSFKKFLKLGIANPKKKYKVYNFEHNTEEYFEIWSKAFDKFVDYARKHFPRTKLIINGIKGSNQITERGKVIGTQQPKRSIDKLNELWSRFDSYCKEKHNIPVITYEKEYTLDPNYIFGLNKEFVHFHLEYYRDAYNKLLSLCTSTDKKMKLSHRNLIRNSDFVEGLKFWSIANCKWIVENYEANNVIKPIGESKKRWKCIWSDPIEINGDGKTEYTLSFYVKIEQILLEEQISLFGIRTFKKAVHKEYQESVFSEIVNVSRNEIEKNIAVRVVHHFKPNGKFIRIAPHIKNEINNIEFFNIQLEKGEQATEYKKCIDDNRR